MVRCPYILRVLIILGYILSQIGFPILESPEVVVDSPYPCRGHQCGCTSAEVCWNGCCCFSTSQRLAWAKQHDVVPPHEFVESDVAIAKVDEDERSKCCQTNEHTLAHSCDGKRPVVPSRVAVAIQSLKCRGHASYWFMASEPALVNNARVVCRNDQSFSEPISLSSDFIESWRDVPPVPPG